MIREQSMKHMLGIALLAGSIEALANQTCTGQVENVEQTSQGLITVDFDAAGKHNVICGLAFDHGQISKDACKNIQVLLNQAKESSSRITLHFNGKEVPSCGQISWSDFSLYGLYHVSGE